MGRIPNYKFSIKEGRQLSTFESGVDSIKRRLSNSITRSRCSGREREVVTRVLSRSSYSMPKYKNGQVEVNGDGDGSSSHGSGPSGNSNGNGVGSGNGSGNNNGHNGNNSSGNRQNRGSTESQSSLNLGPFSQSVGETVQLMSELQKAIKNLGDLYTKYKCDIGEIPKIQQRSSELEKECKDKDEKIKNLKKTIDVLKDMSREEEEQTAQEKADITNDRKVIEAEKKDLKKQKEIAEKRVKAQEAEQKVNQDKELEKLRAKQEKQFKDHKKKLEQDMKKREDENQERLNDLEAENKKQTEELKEQKKQTEEQMGKFAKAKEEIDDLTRVKNSLKEDTHKLEMQLKTKENEFALNSQTTEFYKEKFHEISKTIENISFKYFKNLNDNDLDTIHKNLMDADSCFASIPISDTEESQNLRIAHAQRVISSSVHEIIWQPFSSEKTLPHPDFVSLLSEISTKLAKSSYSGSSGGHAANVWTALTMRVLQSLSPASPSPPTSTSKGTSPPPTPPPQRADKVVDAILSVLSPLVTPSQEPHLRNELLTLAHSAISVWNFAQTDELELIVCPTLGRENRNEWRSLFFDPPLSPSSDDNDTKTDIISSTHPRIFPLFPRVTARKLSGNAKLSVGPPGSWPESDQEPRIIETCIHAGVGLPEWSTLVVKGKEEEEERKEYLEEVMENAKLNARSRRNGGISRSGSMAGSVSGLPSPIAQWMSEGRKRVIEE